MSKTIKVNEKDMPWKSGLTLHLLRNRCKPEADITVYNGFPVNEDLEVKPGDQVCFIRRGEKPSANEMEHLIVSRHSPEVYHNIRSKTVAIAGVGGLGSSLSIALARLAVGNLIIADFDVVEPSNLNRQQYFIDQIGMFKVEALQDNLRRINPYIRVTAHKVRLDKTNFKQIFSGCDIIAECFDNPVAKSELVEFTLRELRAPIVAVSGIAGYQNMDQLECRKVRPRFYLIGDRVSAAAPGTGLMSPKVGIAAHLQANKILELLLDMNTGEKE